MTNVEKQQLELCVCKTLCLQLFPCPYKMTKLKRDITTTKLIHFFFQVNQVIYSPAPVSSLSFKVLAQIVIKISCPQEKHDEWIHEWINNPKAICPSKFFEKKKKEKKGESKQVIKSPLPIFCTYLFYLIFKLSWQTLVCHLTCHMTRTVLVICCMLISLHHVYESSLKYFEIRKLLW